MVHTCNFVNNVHKVRIVKFKKSYKTSKINRNIESQKISYNAILDKINNLSKNDISSGTIHLRGELTAASTQ